MVFAFARSQNLINLLPHLRKRCKPQTAYSKYEFASLKECKFYQNSCKFFYCFSCRFSYKKTMNGNNPRLRMRTKRPVTPSYVSESTIYEDVLYRKHSYIVIVLLAIQLVTKPSLIFTSRSRISDSIILFSSPSNQCNLPITHISIYIFHTFPSQGHNFNFVIRFNIR